MSDKLGDKLKAIKDEQESRARKKAREREDTRWRKAREEAKPLWDDLVKTLPSLLEDAAKKKKHSVEVLVAGWQPNHFAFSDVQSILCYKLVSWAKQNGIQYDHRGHEIYEGGETPESLWLYW